VKEPAALVKFEGQLRRGQELDEASEFREGWLKVIRIIAGGEKQCDVELRHLTRNGTGRVSGLGPTLASVGILEPSPVAGNTRRTKKPVGRFLQFWKDFSDVSWATAVETQSFNVFCSRVRALLQQIAQRSHCLGLKQEGYCFHFLYRKILIAEAHFRNESSTSFAAVDWHSITVGDLKYMSADSKDHLNAFDDHIGAGALSQFFFGRDDWPLFLSCFACLWHDTIECHTDAEQVAGSDGLYNYAYWWRLRNGIPPHPCVLLQDYFRTDPKSASPDSKKRPRLVVSISEEASPRVSS